MDLPKNMDCSLLGSDNKEGTVPMEVVPFSNSVYIYTISASLFFICCAIVFYFYFKSTNSYVPSSQTISIISAIIGITSIILYNLYNNTPATFNYLFFGIIGIIIAFGLLIYVNFTDKNYLIESLKYSSKGFMDVFNLIKIIIINISWYIGSYIGSLIFWLLSLLIGSIHYIIQGIQNGLIILGIFNEDDKMSTKTSFIVASSLFLAIIFISIPFILVISGNAETRVSR